jgi:uncharacterized cupin superfamily protein
MLHGENMSNLIIKKKYIDSMEGLQKTHFLNTNAVRTNKSLGDLTGMNGLGFHIIEVQPGRESTEYHFHHFEDECVYILSGDATVTIGGVDHSVSAGDFIGHPAGTEAHTMKNTGQSLLVCIVAGQRLAHDVADYPNLNKRIFRNNGINNLANINELEIVSVGKKSIL